MSLEINQIYHIYNRGNNKGVIFFTEENYRFFLWKIRMHLLPFGDLICYSLMPNHYHLLFLLRELEISRTTYHEHLNDVELLRRKKKYGPAARPITTRAERRKAVSPTSGFLEALGTMQQTYAKAINHQQGNIGHLFGGTCHLKPGWEPEDNALDLGSFFFGSPYLATCFHYIHNNFPSNRGFIQATDWEYSSAREYAGLRNGTLCNLSLGRAILGLEDFPDL